MTIFFENYYPISKVEGFYIKKLSLEFLIFLRHNNFFLKMKTFFRHKPKLLVLRTLWMFVKFLIFVAENPRIPFYPFIFLYHENMEFRVFCGIFNEIFKKFQILFFPYMKLQLLTNNVFIIFDNCAFKIQNSKNLVFGWCHNQKIWDLTPKSSLQHAEDQNYNFTPWSCPWLPTAPPPCFWPSDRSQHHVNVQDSETWG